jgi:putative MATE family efflux protein
MLHGPVLPTLLKLAAPNIVMMVAQAVANFLESYFVGLLGVNELAGVALVFPLIMLMQMLSAGAIGGGISSSVARALGAGKHERAEAIALHAVVIAIAGGALSSAALLIGGGALYRLMGGSGAALPAALAYSNVVFTGAVFLWLLNALASVLRGTGNMALPAWIVTAGVPVLVLVSPLLIFGLGPIPGFGIAGAAAALVSYYLIGCAVLLVALLRGSGGIRLTWRHALRAEIFAEILRVGVMAAVSSVMTNVSVALATSFVGVLGVHALAGFGLGVRLEYLLVPIVFGFGSGMVAMIGMNVGAGQLMRARQVAWTGAAISVAITETIGMAAALFAHPFLRLFTQDAAAIASGAAYLHVAGPAYGLVGLGLALQFGSQGAKRMGWSVVAGLGRGAAIAIAGTLAMHVAEPRLGNLSIAVIVSLVVYAGFNVVPWLRRPANASRLSHSA